MMDYESKAINAIRSLIENKGLKQKAVAEKCGYSEQAFSALMTQRKRLTLDDLVTISSALDVSLNDLIVINERA